MILPLTGGCVCGAVRFEVDAKPHIMLKCHCRMCQKVSGGPYTPVVVVGKKHFKLTKGALKYYSTPSLRDGMNKRGFCPDCGSRISGAELEDGSRPWMGLTATCFDDSSWFHPLMDVFTSHAQIWDLMDPAIPKHAEYSPK
jgi:hypothetical protein